jgi:hypothetical protein
VVLVLVLTGNLRMGFGKCVKIKWTKVRAKVGHALANRHHLNPTKSRTDNKMDVKVAQGVINGNTHILECLFVVVFTNFVEKIIVFVTVISFSKILALEC